MLSNLLSRVRSLFSRPVAPAPAVPPAPPAPVVTVPPAPAPVEPPPPVVVEPPASPPPPPVVVEPPAPPAPVVPPAPAPVVVVVKAPRPGKVKAPKAPKADPVESDPYDDLKPPHGSYNPDPKGAELVGAIVCLWEGLAFGDKQMAEDGAKILTLGSWETMTRNALSGSLWNRYRANKIRHGQGHAESLPKASQVTGTGKFFAHTENGAKSLEAAHGVVGYLKLQWAKKILKARKKGIALVHPMRKLTESDCCNYTVLGFLAGSAANYLSELVNDTSRGYKENEDGTTQGVKKAESLGERETVSREPEPGWGLEGKDTRAQKRWILGQVLADADRKLVKAWALQTAGARVGARHHDEKVRTKPETVYGKSRATTQRRLEEFREVIKEALGDDDKLESIRVMLRMAQLLSIGL